MALHPLVAALALTASSATPGSPHSLIERLYDAFNRHDVTALQELYTPDAVLQSPDFCKSRSGRDVARTYGRMFSQLPDIHDAVQTVVIEGDRAAVLFVATSGQGSRPLRLELMTMLRFRNGRIIEDITLFDAGGQPCEP